MRRFAGRLALLALLLTAVGCEVRLSAVTAAPPGKTAELDDADELITISKGVALGFECTFQGRECENATAESRHPDIAQVWPASVDWLGRDQVEGPQPAAVFVVVGKQVGTTTLKIDTADGDDVFDVDVIAD